ncbi:MAG: hypothetical protein ACYS0D_05830 [Planctomycetota bacterium]|jgi:hypothetical protein
MKNTRSTAEQIRPILQAMERSIESARRRRLHTTSPSRVEPNPAPITGDEPTERPRQKARPKRDTSLGRRFDGSEFRAPAL